MNQLYLPLGFEVCAIWWAQPLRSQALAYQLSWLQQDLNSLLFQRRTTLNPIRILAAYVQSFVSFVSFPLLKCKRLELRFRETNVHLEWEKFTWRTRLQTYSHTGCWVEVWAGVCYVEEIRTILLMIRLSFADESTLKFTLNKTNISEYDCFWNSFN